MGDRRPTGEKEFNPLDDALDLIGRVMEGQGADAPQQKTHPLQSVQRTAVPTNVVELERTTGLEHPRRMAEEEPSVPEREEYVICKFKVPKSDYQRVKRILAALEEELDARIDLSNIGRGWITRLITADKELLEAARGHEKLKTPNPRDPLEVAEVDHAMATIQSSAFRKAKVLQ
jgi:hypothetical protein